MTFKRTRDVIGSSTPPAGVRGEDARQAAYAAEAALATMLHEQGYNVLTDKGTVQTLRERS